MPDTATKKLYEERVNVWRSMQDILAEAEKREDGLLDATENEQYEKHEARIQQLNKTIEARQRAESMATDFAAPRGEPNEPPGEPPNPEARASAAFDDWVRHGTGDMQGMSGFGSMRAENRSVILGLAAPEAETRDIGVATGAAGGFMVPQGFLDKLTETKKYFGPMYQLSNVIQTTSGNDMPWPTNDDTANVGAILAENVAITALDVALTSKTLKAWMYTSRLVKASWQLLNDSAFDVESFLTRKLGQRLGRIQNTHFTTGNGTTQPEGIITNAVANSPITTMATGTTASFGTTGSTGTAITNGFNGLVDTLHNINPAYRATGSFAWQMADTILAAVRKLSDNQGRPVWIPSGAFTGVAGQDPDSLLGYPVYINSDMATFGVSQVIAAIGDWKQYYIIREVLGVQMVRLDERYADQLQAGFFAFNRIDGRVDDVKAASFLVTAAS